MFTKLKVGLFCLVVFLGAQAAGLAKKRTTSRAIEAVPARGSTTTTPAMDVCSLLDRSAIASVQGTAVQQTQATGGDSADLNISQCYYVAISGEGKNLSVHLQVIQRNPQSSKRDAVHEFWEKRFEREESEHERGEKRGESSEEEEEGVKPVAVRGLGNEAFWIRSGRAGTLFVRSHQKIIRLSLGGSENETEKVQKSKTLAKQVLARLK